MSAAAAPDLRSCCCTVMARPAICGRQWRLTSRDHTVVAPDLRRMGLSAKPAGGFDKKTQAADMAGVLDQLGIARSDLVTHDIGNMVGCAIPIGAPGKKYSRTRCSGTSASRASWSNAANCMKPECMAPGSA